MSRGERRRQRRRSDPLCESQRVKHSQLLVASRREATQVPPQVGTRPRERDERWWWRRQWCDDDDDGVGQQRASEQSGSNARVARATRRARPRCRDRPGPLTYITRGVQVPHIRVSTHKRYSAAPSRRSGPGRVALCRSASRCPPGSVVRFVVVVVVVVARRRPRSPLQRGKRRESVVSRRLLRACRLFLCVRREIEEDRLGR